MMKYLEGESLTQDDVEKLLDLAIAQGNVIPVFVGSAIKLQGIEDLMDEIVTFFPKPTAHGPMHTTDGKEVAFSESGDFSGFVFKTLSDPYVGRLSFVKVVSGALKPNTEIVNSRTGKKERVAHVLKMTGKESADVEAAPAGDIAVLAKLSDTLTNDTLSAKGGIAFDPLPLPEPLYPVAIVAKTKADEDKLGTALKRIVDEDPSLLDPPRRGDAPDGSHLDGRHRDRRRDLEAARALPRRGRAHRPAHPLPRDDPQDGAGPGPSQEADRRVGPVRRLLAADRAEPRRRLRVQGRDRGRQDLQALHRRDRSGASRRP